MDLEFDPAKDAANIEKHGVSLARAADVDVLIVIEDDRFAYGEIRYLGFGLMNGLPWCIVFVAKEGVMRVISLRRAHRKEFARYV